MRGVSQEARATTEFCRSREYKGKLTAKIRPNTKARFVNSQSVAFIESKTTTITAGCKACRRQTNSGAATRPAGLSVQNPTGTLRVNILTVPRTDTSSSAQVQLRIYRAMTGEQRLLIASEMSQFARELAKQRIRQEHPDWPEAQVTRELLRLAFLPEPLPSLPR